MKPKLIITCNPGRERRTELEVGDVIFHYDENVFIRKSEEHRGVLAVYTKLNPYKAYRLLIISTLAYPQRIVPVTELEKLKAIVEKLGVKTVRLRCEARGMYQACRELGEKCIEELKIGFGRGLYTLHIESIEGYTGYSILPVKCDSYGKLLEDNELRRKCIKFSSLCEEILKRS